MKKDKDIPADPFLSALLGSTEPAEPTPDAEFLAALGRKSADVFQASQARPSVLRRFPKAAAVLLLFALGGVAVAVIQGARQPRVTLSIWVDKLIWSADEVPAVKFDVSHRGPHDLERRGGFELEVNGRWYSRKAAEAGNPTTFRKETDYRNMALPLDNRWKRDRGAIPLTLKPGDYRIRLAFLAREPGAEAQLRILSDAAEFRVVEKGRMVSRDEWLDLAAGGAVTSKYTAQQVAERHRAEHGASPGHAALADYYYEQTHILGQSGIPKAECVRWADMAERAFAFRHTDVRTLRLYMYLGDACWRQTKKYSPELWRRQRQVAAVAYFEGLKYALSLDLPFERPERNGVFRYQHGAAELRGRQLLRAARGIARDCDGVRDAVFLRQVLAGQIIGMYNRAPKAPEELYRTAVDALNSEVIARALVDAAGGEKIVPAHQLPPFLDPGEEDAPDALLAHQETGVMAGFMPDKPSIMAGEPVFLTFVVQNITDSQVKLSLKGHRLFRRYPLSASPRRFTITAVDENGKAVKAPASFKNAVGMEDGRVGGVYGEDLNLPAGTAYAERLFLPHWLSLDAPGTYVVRCRCNIDPKPIVSTFELTVTAHGDASSASLIAGLRERIQRSEYIIETVLLLSFMDSKKVIAPLLDVLGRDASSESQCLAIQKIGAYPTAEVVAAFMDALSSRHRDVRKAALEALRSQGMTDDAVDEWLKHLNSPAAGTRRAAVRALGTLASDRCIEAVTSALDDASADVRFAAIEVLVRQAGVLHIDRLVEILQASGPNDRHFHNAIKLIRFHGKEEAVPALVRCMDLDDPSPRNQRNFFLLMGIEACRDGPKVMSRYHHDANADGTSEQIQGNRLVLESLRGYVRD